MNLFYKKIIKFLDQSNEKSSKENNNLNHLNYEESMRIHDNSNKHSDRGIL